jgi:hypothetical protein
MTITWLSAAGRKDREPDDLASWGGVPYIPLPEGLHFVLMPIDHKNALLSNRCVQILQGFELFTSICCHKRRL